MRKTHPPDLVRMSSAFSWRVQSFLLLTIPVAVLFTIVAPALLVHRDLGNIEAYAISAYQKLSRIEHRGPAQAHASSASDSKGVSIASSVHFIQPLGNTTFTAALFMPQITISKLLDGSKQMAHVLSYAMSGTGVSSFQVAYSNIFTVGEALSASESRSISRTIELSSVETASAAAGFEEFEANFYKMRVSEFSY